LNAAEALALTAAAATGGLAVGWRRAAARERRLLEGLADLARETSRLPDARQQVCDTALALMGADADALMVPTGGELVADRTSGEELPLLRVAIDDPDAVPARAFREQRLVFASGGAALAHPALRGFDARAVLAVPITRVGVRIGLCIWLWRGRKRRLSARERGLAELISNEKGMAIQRAEMFVQAVDLMRSQVRTRLARDLHDSVAQDLAVVGVYAETAARALEKRPDVLADAVPRLQEHAAKANDQMRELLDTLRDGGTLVELGIPDLVDAVVADFRRRAPGLDVTTEIPAEIGFDVGPAVRETVYFVLREALHNAATHADAGSARVSAQARPDLLTLTVEDDGRGFDPAAAPRGRHGLVGMRERAELAGGRLEVRSAPGSGTTVRLQIEDPGAGEA
jgi:signal transduction histidine kinase